MFLLYNDSTDPAFNLALEEYVLTKLRKDIIILWRNNRSVIIGRNQNAVEEIDIDFIERSGITVIRRQSGGGAVFHDLGNINYTVIQPLGKEDFNNYARFTAPICSFLQSLGINAELKGRNDLLIEDMKFCGNAQAVRNGWIMHHGCILYNADFSDLAKALRPHPAKISGKGIRSVRSRVTNVADHMSEPMEAEEFLQKLYYFFLQGDPDMQEYTLTKEDIAEVDELVEKKYSKWEYNFGRSPAYKYQKSAAFPFGVVDVRVSADGAVINDVAIFGDFFGISDISELKAKLIGVRHTRAHIAEALIGINLGDYISGISQEEFLDLF